MKVKVNLTLLFLISVHFLLVGCQKDESMNQESQITLSQSTFSLGKRGGNLTVTVKHNVDYYISYQADWLKCNLTQATSKSEKTYTIQVDPYDGNGSQSAIITFRAQDNRTEAKLKVTQTGDSFMYGFKFEMEKNPDFLQEDIEFEIHDNKITGRIKHYTSTKSLIPTFDSDGLKVEVENVVQKSGVTANDFSKPLTYVITSKDGEKREYTVELTCFTGLPVIFINTANKVEITSKIDYVNAEIEIDGMGQYEDFAKMTVEMRGRGNSTWGMPKKPYRLKFNKKQTLMGMPAHKSWALMAQYSDKSFLRYEAAFDMSRATTGLAWTPRSRFVELFLNGVYNGTYQLFEIIKINEERVNVTDNGFIVEVENPSRLTSDDIHFKTPRKTFVIKDPDVVTGDQHYTFIKDYVTQVENVLYSANFLDPENGYKKYVNLESFVDWYLVNEITKNNDANMSLSCYMNYAPGGKLNMGPVWDFDISLGNINYSNSENPEGFRIKNAVWFVQMFKDPEFVAMVKDRYKILRAQMPEIILGINSNAYYLQLSMIENNNKWNTLYNYTWPNSAILGSYSNEVQHLKNWLQARLTWLDTAIEGL